MATRRAFLRRAGALGAGAGFLSSTALLAAADHAHEQPAYVSFEYDEATIEAYQPRLLLDGVEQEPQAYYAAVGRSNESDLAVVVGFHKYLTQEGVDPAGADSHLGDREPVYVYFDEASGDPVKWQYSAYHWYENTVYPDEIATDSTGKRAIFSVVPNWHQHQAYRGRKRGELIDVDNLLEAYPNWLKNGLEEEIHPGAVYNPWEEMQDRPYWWADGSQTRRERWLGQLYLWVGIQGAGQSDLNEGWL